MTYKITTTIPLIITESPYNKLNFAANETENKNNTKISPWPKAAIILIKIAFHEAEAAAIYAIGSES